MRGFARRRAVRPERGVQYSSDGGMSIYRVNSKMLAGLTVVLLGWQGLAWGQGVIEKLLDEEQARTQENIKAQQQVERIDDAVDDLVDDYRTVTKIVDGLKVYNDLLQKQIDNQQSEITAIEQSIENVALIERQIVPLMVRMIDSLAAFVELDVPFLPRERSKRVEDLRALLERSDVSVAEKLRRVFEAYQIENDYGRTIEAYRGTVEVEGSPREVDFLRVGRVALLYQTLDGEVTGRWHPQRRHWEGLAAEIYRKPVALGLRMARDRVAPELLRVPVATPVGVTP